DREAVCEIAERRARLFAGDMADEPPAKFAGEVGHVLAALCKLVEIALTDRLRATDQALAILSRTEEAHAAIERIRLLDRVAHLQQHAIAALAGNRREVCAPVLQRRIEVAADHHRSAVARRRREGHAFGIVADVLADARRRPCARHRAASAPQRATTLAR